MSLSGLVIKLGWNVQNNIKKKKKKKETFMLKCLGLKR